MTSAPSIAAALSMSSVLPRTVRRAATKVADAPFRSETKLPKGANKALCAKAVENIALRGAPFDIATHFLTQTEKDFVRKVSAEAQDFIATKRDSLTKMQDNDKVA